jgi:hypothetical protein
MPDVRTCLAISSSPADNHEGGHDLILANLYTNGRDIVKGGTGYDKIKVNDGDSLNTASGVREVTGASLTPSQKRILAAQG